MWVAPAEVAFCNVARFRVDSDGSERAGGYTVLAADAEFVVNQDSVGFWVAFNGAEVAGFHAFGLVAVTGK